MNYIQRITCFEQATAIPLYERIKNNNKNEDVQPLNDFKLTPHKRGMSRRKCKSKAQRERATHYLWGLLERRPKLSG